MAQAAALLRCLESALTLVWNSSIMAAHDKSDKAAVKEKSRRVEPAREVEA